MLNLLKSSLTYVRVIIFWFCGKSWHALAVPSNSHHPPPAPWRSARSDEAHWVSVRQLPHLQWHPSPHIVLHLLQHHAPWGKRGPARWHLHPFLNRWQSLLLLASHRTHENHRGTLSCCWMMTVPFSHTQRKPYSTLSTTSLMQLRTPASPSAWRRLRCCTNPPPWEAYSPPHISINGTNLNAVEHFTYLGSIISNDATVSKDLDNCLFKARNSFRRLSKRVWQSHSLYLSTKIQVYKAVVIPTFLYSAETWVLYRKQIGSKSGYWSSFTNATYTPSLASNSKTMCQMKRSSREPACPA